MNKEDMNVSCFFFSNNLGNDLLQVTIYHFMRVLFGISSSPWLLAATIKHRLKKYSDQFPKTLECFNKGVYMYIIRRDQTVEESFLSTSKIITIFKDTSMNLYKWLTTYTEIYK